MGTAALGFKAHIVVTEFSGHSLDAILHNVPNRTLSELGWPI